MRVWDVPPRELCRAHLLGQHREIHAVWTILTQDKRGYRAHPEVRRWEGKLAALFARHAATVAEMERRGYRHRSPLDERLAVDSAEQRERLCSLAEQRRLLRAKACPCGSSRTGSD